MEHRHLNHQELTLAALDDIIARGRRADWESLRDAIQADRSLLEKIQRVCEPQVADQYAQRYHFWMNYAREYLT